MAYASPDTIALRGYTEKPGQKPIGAKPASFGLDKPLGPTLILDCETTTDSAQALRFGFYQIRRGQDLDEEGIFYNRHTLMDCELTILSAYAVEHGLKLRTVEAFNIEVFLEVGYALGGAIVGFNLPFDISRIALDHGAARDKMRGGFSFLLSRNPAHARVRIKHLNARASLIEFARPGIQETGRSSRKRGRKTPRHRGYFIDLKALSATLTSRSFSLASLAEYLRVPTQKLETDEHGATLSDTYLDYARADVQCTWECYQALETQLAKHGLNKGSHRLLSEASLGKAYLTEMGIKPLLACQDVPRRMFAIAMESYYGGRAEVRIRREVREVVYTDFKSMYPTVNTLIGLWRFVIGNGYSWSDATDETRAFLESVSPSDFQRSDTWRRLTTLVKVCPDNDLFPVRAKYDGKINTIGLNYLTYDGGIWYTLPDVVAAKLLSGKTPEILEAICFEPGEPQEGLKPIDLFGDPDFRIDPETDDAFKQFIDLRDKAKAEKNPVEKAIKILANSTSYGIFIEILRDNAPKPEELTLFGSDGSETSIQTTALEEPGRFFHPLLGTLITGAARLMLALAERVVMDEELEWVFCDTDSLAIARLEGMSRETFHDKVDRVVDWFTLLNPYEKSGSILQKEDENFAPGGSGQPEPLYTLAISAKRYALFNLDDQRRPILRKGSQHGLGHLKPPYADNDPAPGIPDPPLGLDKLGLRRWQYDLWYKIIETALTDDPNKLAYDYHPALLQPAMSHYTATSPDMLAWLKVHNEGREPSEQVKPFGFMVKFTAREELTGEMPEPIILDTMKRGRPTKARVPKPVAPFDTDPAEAVKKAFDRETGETVPGSILKTYAEMLSSYHLSPEYKFANAEYLCIGLTYRRLLMIRKIQTLGKEASPILFIWRYEISELFSSEI